MCKVYDIRVRPWFVAGSTGAKNLIIVMDVSSSMSSKMNQNRTRMDVVIDAYKTMIDGLSISDYVGFVTFSGEAKAYQPTLVQATAENQLDLKNYISELTADGPSNFEVGFEKAFNIFQTSKEQGMNKYGCINIISFMTDGTAS
jgi:Mg-chelatase subunit ChlD